MFLQSKQSLTSFHQPDDATRYRITRQVTLVGAGLNLALAMLKIMVGNSAHSQALIADGVHSLSDLATDVLVLIGAKHGSRKADKEHPYGHGRIETVFTLALSLSLLLVAVGLMYRAILQVLTLELLLPPGIAALLVALLSVIVKESLYHYTAYAATKVHSQLLRANAWHHRSDAISSIVVIAGVAGTLAGWTYLDAAAAIVVALMIARVGVRIGWHNIQELVDTSLATEQVDLIRTTILAIPGVQALHTLRTRRMGKDALVDVHILVNPKLSVSEGHQIGDDVHANLINKIPEVNDVTVHIDPEDDELARPSSDLPNREEVLAQLRQHWATIEQARYLQDATLHYLNGKINVELRIPLDKMQDINEAQEIAKRFSSIAAKEGHIGEIKVLYF